MMSLSKEKKTAIPYHTDRGRPSTANDSDLERYFHLGFILAGKIAESIGRTSCFAFRAHNHEIKEGDERDISSLSNNEWLNFIIDARGESRSGSIYSLKPKIQKVQPMLHEVESNKKCYDPLVVSIGPYHHGKPELYTGERIKMPLARQYVKGHSNATVHALYEEVVNVAGKARKSYAKGLTDFTDESFARMMFLDGCFILQCIYGIVYAIPAVLEIIHHAPLVWQDLFLLKNQLPFGIITNFLRNDEEVVKVISRMAAGLVPDTSYFRVMSSIKQYHSHKGKIRIASWIVEVMRNHFRSPWPAIAVLAALLLFF
ncbi:unnamed protein product [Camellia sinensis]